MFIIMIVAGFLSTMNVWVDNVDDIRISINDLYMVLLMTGYMFLFMGLLYSDFYPALFGLLLVVGSFWAIRRQFMMRDGQFLRSMIPHHSMAVLMSKRYLENNSNPVAAKLAANIINSQKSEIEYMKDTIIKYGL